VIVDDRVGVTDIGHVHRIGDIGDVHVRFDNPLSKHRLTDVSNVNKVIIGGPDIVIYVDVSGDRRAFVDELVNTARRQRCPSDVVSTRSPGNPSRAPFTARYPEPAAITEADPTPIVIGGPTKILIGDPSPTDVRIGPVSIRVWAPSDVCHSNCGLVAIPVISHLNPAAIPANVVVEKIQ
jgi:hypothetical protein